MTVLSRRNTVAALNPLLALRGANLYHHVITPETSTDEILKG
jgi:hypothetical protein